MIRRFYKRTTTIERIVVRDRITSEESFADSSFLGEVLEVDDESEMIIDVMPNDTLAGVEQIERKTGGSE